MRHARAERCPSGARRRQGGRQGFEERTSLKEAKRGCWFGRTRVALLAVLTWHSSTHRWMCAPCAPCTPKPSPLTGPCLFASCSHARTGASYRGSTCGIDFPSSIPCPCLFAYAVLSYALEASFPFQAKRDKGQAGVGEEEGRYQVWILPRGKKKKKKKVTFV